MSSGTNGPPGRFRLIIILGSRHEGHLARNSRQMRRSVGNTMNEQPQVVCETLNSKTLWRRMASLMLVALIASATLAATNRRGWTHVAPWIPPAFVLGLSVYSWSLIRWTLWGESRRAIGRPSLFGPTSRIGATAASHSLLFQTVVGGAICVIGGFETATRFPGTLGVALLPGLVIGTSEVFEHGEVSVFYRCMMWFGYPMLVVSGHIAGRYGFTWENGAVSVALLVLGASLLTRMVWLHARDPWPGEKERRSPGQSHNG